MESRSALKDIKTEELTDNEDEEDDGESLSPEQKWLPDDDIAKLTQGITCDLPILSALGEDGDVDPNFEVPAYLIDKLPYIIRDYTLDWPAKNDDNWQYYKL